MILEPKKCLPSKTPIKAATRFLYKKIFIILKLFLFRHNFVCFNCPGLNIDKLLGHRGFIVLTKDRYYTVSNVHITVIVLNYVNSFD